MKIRRTIPPTATPIGPSSLLHGLAGLFMGRKYLKKLEEEVKEHFGTNHVFFVSSGKAALTVILKALKSLSPGRETVLIPAYTCFSVPSAIVTAGLKVSLCDIDPSTFDFDYTSLEDAMDKETLCVLSTHLFGIPSDTDRINGICKDRGIFVVEDAAQAMGGRVLHGEYKGRMLGTVGDAGLFSLSRGKNITCGSGGIIITGSGHIAGAISKAYSSIGNPGTMETAREFLKALALSLFIHPSLFWMPSGMPSLKLGAAGSCDDFPIKRLSGMQAGLLNIWRDQLEKSNRIRSANARYFTGQLQMRSYGSAPIPLLRLPVIMKTKEARDRISGLSSGKGLGITRMYACPVNEMGGLREQFEGRSFPSASRVAENLLTIPTHHLLSERDKKNIRALFEDAAIAGNPGAGVRRHIRISRHETHHHHRHRRR
ncbi:MAG: aminotransferase class V-fold PLP-dependent enzyme [Nitrospirae bacterium]|nr:aminotransferase class V-fold PLP-dependent enzyme [Nitrospirota bacterium]